MVFLAFIFSPLSPTSFLYLCPARTTRWFVSFRPLSKSERRGLVRMVREGFFFPAFLHPASWVRCLLFFSFSPPTSLRQSSGAPKPARLFLCALFLLRSLLALPPPAKLPVLRLWALFFTEFYEGLGFLSAVIPRTIFLSRPSTP